MAASVVRRASKFGSHAEPRCLSGALLGAAGQTSARYDPHMAVKIETVCAVASLALLASACGIEATSGRTRESAHAAADAALVRHSDASLLDRNQLADLAAMTCGRLDDGDTGSEIVGSMASDFEAEGVPMGNRIAFVEIMDTLVEEHCPSRYEQWRGPE